MSMPLLRLENISVKRFSQKILDDISLTINAGDFVMLIGANGSGKSTLLRTINGLITPSHGRIMLTNQDVTRWPMHRIAHDIATLTQDIHQSTFSDLTVENNLNLALARAQHAPAVEKDKIDYLARFNPTLKDRYRVLAGRLSGGQRQALALAMCFAHRPQLLLLDEHTSALDPKAASTLMTLSDNFIATANLTTIMITHHLDQVLRYGNRLVVLNEGKVVADINAQEKEKLTINDIISFAYSTYSV